LRGFKSMRTARRIIAGCEISSMIRKNQVAAIPANAWEGLVAFVGFTCQQGRALSAASLYFNTLGHSSPSQIDSEVGYSWPM